MTASGPDVFVVGAGLAGLACARELAGNGARVRVVDRAPGVGGRCATRRVEGQPVDHGLPFLHGSSPEFFAAIDEVDAEALDGWPFRIAGRGAPCQPPSFAPGERRVAFAEGLTVFPKHLARGLDVRLGAAVAGIETSSRVLRLRFENGTSDEAPAVVLALAPSQADALLGGLESPQAASARAVVGFAAPLPCLTVIALYPAAAPRPGWDVLSPEDLGLLQLVSHDSAKRAAPSHRALVFQCLARASRERLAAPEAEWSREVLAEAAALLGGWAGRPLVTENHAWRQARIEARPGLPEPLLLTLDNGARLGLAGELFALRPGAEGAFLSGMRLARRLARLGS